jgi:hypothetical protein
LSAAAGVSDVSLANACQALDIAAPSSSVRRDIVPCEKSLVIEWLSILQRSTIEFPWRLLGELFIRGMTPKQLTRTEATIYQFQHVAQ